MEELRASGHANVTAGHATTIAITRDGHLTTRGDCIIGVNADKGLHQLSEEFKRIAKSSRTQILVKLEADGFRETITGWGCEDLIFGDEYDLVIRKSDFICPRTLMIKADKASKDLDRRLVESLRSKETELLVKISAKQ